MDYSSRPTILGIDDAVDEFRDLATMLVEHFDVKVSTDGRHGYERAQAIQPALILLDVAMPGMDGFAVCRLLKINPVTQSIPVIFLTSHTGPAVRVQGFRLGAVDFVSKPYLPEEVLARIQIHLRSREPRSASQREEAVSVSGIPIADLHVRAAWHFIAQSLDDDALSVEHVALAVGLTERRLRVLFREQLGLTVIGFIAEQRMNTARRLLRETGMAVQEVALEVGFRNPGNFATAFRERTGLTPHGYRDALKASGCV